MIHVENLKKVFTIENVETHAIQNIFITIEKGEFVAVMGPSGCGKTTLLNLLGLLVKPSGGKYVLMGKDVSDYTENQRVGFRKGNIGFVFQSFNLIDELNVYENVELPLLYLRIPSKERKKRVLNILEHMNMAHRRKFFPQQLSGGQQQRVAIARALAGEPRFLLADEPTGNLDSHMALGIMELIREINGQGTTIIMVTHDPTLADMAQRNVHILDGKVHIMDEQPSAGVEDTNVVHAVHG